jgi:hypothetical protein
MVFPDLVASGSLGLAASAPEFPLDQKTPYSHFVKEYTILCEKSVQESFILGQGQEKTHSGHALERDVSPRRKAFLVSWLFAGLGLRPSGSGLDLRKVTQPENALFRLMARIYYSFPLTQNDTF